MAEESLDFGATHLLGMAFVVKEDVTFDPGQVTFFGMDGVMFEAKRFADLIEQFFGWGGVGH